MRLLLNLLSLAVLFTSTSAVVYTCTDIRDQFANKTFRLPGDYACIILDGPASGYDGTLAALTLVNKSPRNNDTAPYYVSFVDIAASPTHCAQVKTDSEVWRVLSSVEPSTLNCTKEIILILGDQAVDFAIANEKATSYSVSPDSSLTIVSPRAGMKLAGLKCESTDMTDVNFLTGAMETNTMKTYHCDELPMTYITFDTAITITPDGTSLSFILSNDYTNGGIFNVGDRVAIHSTGWADTLMNTKPKDDWTRFQLNPSMSATKLDVTSVMHFDTKYDGSLDYVIQGPTDNHTETFTRAGTFKSSYSANAFEVRYHPVPPNPEYGVTQDQFVIDVVVSDLPTPTPAALPYCTCSPKSTWVDVVFLLDVSGAMGQSGVDKAIKSIQSTLAALTIDQTDNGKFYTRAAFVTYAAEAQVIYDFPNMHSSTIPNLGNGINVGSTEPADLEKAITAARSIFSKFPDSSRPRTPQVIVVLSTSHKYISDVNADSFKKMGGVIATVDFIASGGTNSAALHVVASPGYSTQVESVASLDGSFLTQGLCDANCFCPTASTEYDLIGSARPLPNGGCYQGFSAQSVEVAAKASCAAFPEGILPTIHDEDKQLFLMGLLPARTPFWIGLERDATTGEFLWSDNATDPYTKWAPGEPGIGNCAYSMQYSGFKNQWRSDDCSTATYKYICQSRPCDSSFYCF